FSGSLLSNASNISIFIGIVLYFLIILPPLFNLFIIYFFINNKIPAKSTKYLWDIFSKGLFVKDGDLLLWGWIGILAGLFDILASALDILASALIIFTVR